MCESASWDLCVHERIHEKKYFFNLLKQQQKLLRIVNDCTLLVYLLVVVANESFSSRPSRPCPLAGAPVPQPGGL